MKLKLIISYIVLIAFSMGCKKDLLNVKNENNYTDETYFKTQTQFNEAIIATYAVFNQGGMMSREWYFIFDLLANDAERASPLVGTEQELAEYQYTPNNDDLVMLWASLYRMNFRANLALHVMEDWEPQNATDETLKKQYIAEAHWLRGFAYFNLVTNWGKVPLRLTYESSQQNSAPRSSVEEVWNVVENEFKAAIPDLPVVYSADQLGRATKGAAVAFLGRSYLFQKKYDSAITELKQLITAPYNYSLDPSYDHLFSEDNINSPEVVFAVNHVYTTPNTQYYMFGDWESANGRTAHTGRAQEYGFNDWQNVIVSDALVSAFKYPNPSGGGSYTDPRSKLVYYGTFANEGDPDYCDYCNAGPLTYPYDLFGNSWRKYEPYEYKQFTEAPMSGINTHVIRYAGVLLMLAESYIEKGDNISAGITLVNEVRNRPSVMAVNYQLTLSQAEARVALRRERQIELAGEQSRWFDLNRWGIAVDVLTKEKPASAGQKPFLPKYVLFPIPTPEIEANRALAGDVANEWN
jgi:hypothetical protein